MTIQELMQKWDFNYIIPYEYSNVEELVEKADGTLLILLASKCHISHKKLMYVNSLWANEGKAWLNYTYYKHIFAWIQKGITLGESDVEIYQSDYTCSSFAVSEIFNEMNRFHCVSQNTEQLKKDRLEFLTKGGNIIRENIGSEIITLLNNAINQ